MSFRDAPESAASPAPPVPAPRCLRRFAAALGVLVSCSALAACGEEKGSSAAEGSADPDTDGVSSADDGVSDESGSTGSDGDGPGSSGDPDGEGSSPGADDGDTSSDGADDGSEGEGSADDGDPSAGGSDDAASGGESEPLGDESGPGALPDGTNPGGVDLECEPAEPGVTSLAKLSTVQYRNTVRDLLAASGIEQLTAQVENALARVPDDSLGDSFRGLDNRTSIEHVQGYLDVGIALGDAVGSDADALEALVGNCALSDSLSEDCARDFLERFLLLAQRRPASETDIAEYLALIDPERSPAESIAAMIVVALSSPRFVNQLEIDGTASQSSADILQLTSYEIASRLSYTFWQTMPDAELLEAAADGSLASEDGYEAQLARVFDDPRTRQTLWQFWNEWLKLEKFTGFESSRPGFRALGAGTALDEGHDYYADMVTEVRDLTELLTFSQQSTIADVLLTEVSVTESPELAALYGVEPYSGSGDHPMLPAGTRLGVFQRAALLANSLEQTNPFHRGAFIRRHVLCDDLPQPNPNDLPAGALDPPPQNDDQTTRERFQAKVEGNALCEGCHATFSDIGYVLESFDALGRHRTTEIVYDESSGEVLAELPLDTSAVPRIDTSDASTVSGPMELGQKLLESQKVEACLSENYFAYALRRLAESDSVDSCVIQDLTEMLRSSDQGLARAFARVAQHESFFLRKVGPR